MSNSIVESSLYKTVLDNLQELYLFVKGADCLNVDGSMSARHEGLKSARYLETPSFCECDTMRPEPPDRHQCFCMCDLMDPDSYVYRLNERKGLRNLFRCECH